VIDTGLINAISFKFSQNIGRLYENVVLIELKRRDKDVYYWKNKYECDFLTTQGDEVKEAIQVCYELTDENKDREINGLIETMDEFKLNDGLIITGDLEEEEIRGGKKIVYKPLWKWLLE
jgi:predicted AAA+ superfamily ATPase